MKRSIKRKDVCVLSLNKLVVAIIGTASCLPVTTFSANFDLLSPSVTQAYIGPITYEKMMSAYIGLNHLLKESAQVPGIYYPGNPAYSIVFGPSPIDFPPSYYLATNSISANSDSDLGGANTLVSLNGTRLNALASFSTTRDFNIGVNGGAINTNNYDLNILGKITAQGWLCKEGTGKLTLTGNNAWNGNPIIVMDGTLRGNTSSLQTNIYNYSKVEFNQSLDGTYDGVISNNGSVTKSGSGVLTFTQANSYTGETHIAEGTLKLSGVGSLNTSTGITIDSGAVFDISAASSDRIIRTLAGSGNVILGSNDLHTYGAIDSTFEGTISGAGSLRKGGLNKLTVSNVNTYSGNTILEDGMLSLSGMGRLNTASKILFGTGTLDISTADGDRTVGSIEGMGYIYLGANTLIAGGDNTSAFYGGSIQGSGGITKTGAGTLVLGGMNSFTGRTTINQGVLQTTPYGISNTVNNNGTLILMPDNFSGLPISAYSGNITGTGKLVKEGEGIVWLRGTNAYSGGTFVVSVPRSHLPKYMKVE